MKHPNTLFRAAAPALLWIVFAVHPAAAQIPPEPLPKGRIVDRVVCQEDANQSYALYLPSYYTPERASPILFCFDPGARGRVPVERFQEGAEKYGFILAGSNNSRNGPFAVTIRALNAIWNDAHAKFAVNDRRVFAAGMSGGARAVCSLAQTTGLMAGVVACSGGFPGSQPPKSVPFFFYGTAGIDDFNYPELRQLDGELEKLGVIKKIVTFEGGHEWPPKPVCSKAIEWLELQSMKAGTRSRDTGLIDSFFADAVASILAAETARRDPGEIFLLYKAIVADFKGMKDVSAYERKADALASSKEVKRFFREEEAQRVQQNKRMTELYSLWNGRQDSADENYDRSSFAAVLSDLKRQSEAAKDSGTRRVARRLLHGLYVDAYQQGQAELEQKRYIAAAGLLELAATVRPDSPLVYYNLASAYAQMHDKRHALEALKKSVEKGFKDLRRISEDPAFELLRSDPALKKLLERLN